ncbi:protein of unknown function [Methylocaldum szegediense]|uniref:Uncharacterized protein n=1 Tax=Methylocaldum szegediense TaxID=73780 RepID=A0ABM9HYY2_9GAMM|nr:protein of unknown function [Methylocaldum szegediense]
MIKPADLSGVAFHDGVAHGYLSVATDDDFIVAADGYDGSAVKLFHRVTCLAKTAIVHYPVRMGCRWRRHSILRVGNVRDGAR